MIPVFQTKYGERDGNCFMACVASILEISLEDCPDLYDETGAYAPGTNWLQVAADWAYAHADALLIGLGPNDDGLMKPPQGYAIISGLSPFGYMHACVALNGQVVHDPHPHGLGLVQITDMVAVIPLCRGAIQGIPYREQLAQLQAGGQTAGNPS
jgi:hypothetical protein